MLKFRKRDFKVKNRLSIEADYLKDYGFTSGTNLIYTINSKKNKVIIRTTKNEGNSRVYKTTQHRKKIVPVIDIRSEEIVKFIKDNTNNLELCIYEGKIILKTKRKIAVKGKGKLLSFRKRTNIVAMSARKFADAIGCEQLDLFDMFTYNEDDYLDEHQSLKSIEKKGIKLISLFSGCGMLDKGFLDQGFDIEFAIDKTADVEYDSNGKKKRPSNDLGSYHIETYKFNIGNHIVDRDVLSLQKSDIPKANIVIGGIPCTKFSKLNTSVNSYRKSESSDFPLLDKYIDVVRWSEANAFLIENVPDFVTAKNGILLERLKNSLKDFNITYKIINSKDLGSAQSRTRVFILGMKNIEPKIELPKLCEVRTVGDAFKDIEKTKQHHLYGQIKENSKAWERMKHVPPGGNYSNVPEHLKSGKKKFNDYCIRLDNKKHSPTITHIGDSVICPENEMRKLSISEGSRLFSMPDDFEFKGSITSMYEQLKNGVDYRVSTFLAKIIKEQLTLSLGMA